MEFRLSLVTQYEPSRDLDGIADELATQVELAREGGFDAIGVPEHHVTEDQYLFNEAVVAHLTDHVGDMELGTAMCLLPYHHPVRIAEFGATMDVLTGGGFSLGVAQGYRQAEFDAFGVDRGDALGRFVEGVEVIERLWTEDRVSYDGRHFQLDDVTINPKPVQDPRPELLVGASNEASIRRAARIADGWSAGHVPFDGIGTRVEAFRDERAGTDRGAGTVEIGREVFVAETSEEAEATVKEPLLRKYRRYVDWGQDEVFEDDEFESAWEELQRDRFIVGSPDDVIGELQRYRDAFDPDGFRLRTQYQGMDAADVHESIRLLSEDVLPSFR
jgi:alkanesulfonate monooxygenase SsuD/methylene tetrahydromethanopterin reductase-like flavin-dependent oxidoreductase (luciferase family)